MIEISVTIPTLKPRHALVQLIEEITATIDPNTTEVIASCIDQSAAKNRNWCIDNAKGKYIIQIDDDMTGFYKGWAEDLIRPLRQSPEKYSIVAARLLTRERKDGPQLGWGDGAAPNLGNGLYKALHTTKTGLNVVCSACISFIKGSTRFDENFLRAVWEDTDFSMQMNKDNPDKCIIINTNCKLIHLGEAKGREQIGHNRTYFINKWKVIM